MNCDDCVYTDIADWEQDGDKAIPILWCERFEKLCKDIKECPFKAGSGET